MAFSGHLYSQLVELVVVFGIITPLKTYLVHRSDQKITMEKFLCGTHRNRLNCFIS